MCLTHPSCLMSYVKAKSFIGQVREPGQCVEFFTTFNICSGFRLVKHVSWFESGEGVRQIWSPLDIAILTATSHLNICPCFAGEIIPQAVCTRYGLAVGAYSAWFVQILMYLCFVLAWPISKILDFVLGSNHTVRALGFENFPCRE